MNFIGRYYHALEQKGRLSIPKSFRKKLGESGILTQGLEGCLFLFTAKDWQQIAEQAASLPFTSKVARDWVRLLAQSAANVSFDRLGRILIPEPLRTYAHLQKKVVVAGSLTRIEIWDQQQYHQYLGGLNQNAESIAEAVSSLARKE